MTPSKSPDLGDLRMKSAPPHHPPLYPLLYDQLLDDALREDLGRAGDLTSDAIVPPDLFVSGRIRARRPGRVAGLDLSAATFRRLSAASKTEIITPDSSDVAAGETLAVVRGPARELLSAERVALNLLGRLSGIATATRDVVRAIAEHPAKVVCTRKTTPLLRGLEKYAVRIGGGANHRFGLDDAVLIKDNHRTIAGSAAEAVARARRSAGHLVKIEVEVDDLDELEALVGLGIDAVLLDNMTFEQLSEAVKIVDHRIITEASGGITPQTAVAVASSGVDLLSFGWLTHSVASLDVGFDLDLEQAGVEPYEI